MAKTDKKSGAQVGVQKFGRFLSGMVQPNIGAFIAWGLITALFIPTGWLPNEHLGQLVGPMVTYLLPLLIGYTGGKMIHDVRGGVLGAIATMGVIVGSTVPMFIGAMVMGPLGGYLMKKVDQLFEGRIKSGFEMLVNNFSAGILGAILACLGSVVIGPVITMFSNMLESGVQAIVNVGLLPLANVFIEPAKVLFLNNAINHGVLSPLGLKEAADTGQSIFFLLESNPGPGLGILLAYWFFGKGTAKSSAPGAAIIHFFGGIHEIYFPYVLMNPRLILAAIAGGVTGTFVFTITGAALVAVPSPGSIFALLAMAPKGGMLPVLAGVAAATAASFFVAALLLKSSKKTGEDLDEATAKMKDMKATSKGQAVGAVTAATATVDAAANEFPRDVKKVIFACDAGMGSSAMGASVLRKKFKDAGLTDIEVKNTAISDIPMDTDIVVTQVTLTDRAVQRIPNAYHVSVENFLNSPKYQELIDKLKQQ
ncbi:PTS mannitol transporter subunit IICB [Paenibacillus marinisediminis]